jgi:hypothetical protein
VTLKEHVGNRKTVPYEELFGEEDVFRRLRH